MFIACISLIDPRCSQWQPRAKSENVVWGVSVCVREEACFASGQTHTKHSGLAVPYNWGLFETMSVNNVWVSVGIFSKSALICSFHCDYSAKKERNKDVSLTVHLFPFNRLLLLTLTSSNRKNLQLAFVITLHKKHAGILHAGSSNHWKTFYFREYFKGRNPYITNLHLAKFATKILHKIKNRCCGH